MPTDNSSRAAKPATPPTQAASPNAPTKPRADADGTVLTVRQRKVLQVIRESVATRGYPPSVREIGERVGLKSPSSVAY